MTTVFYPLAPSADRPATLPVLPHHLDDLRRSGLSDDIIRAGGIYSTWTEVEISRILGWTPFGCQSALIFPYRDSIGNNTGYARLKPTPTLLDSNGRAIKYLAPRGTTSRLYFPPFFAELFARCRFIIVTEGEKKALKAAQHGLPAIAVPGVWCFRSKYERLIADFNQLPLQGLRVFIGFDSDIATNTDVLDAEECLADELTLRGARVFRMRIPASPNGNKQGLDDFLLATEDSPSSWLGRDSWQRVAFEAEARRRWLFERSEPPADNIVDLTLWRQQLVDQRLMPWRFGNPRVDLSPPGSGKSTADRVRMANAQSSLTVVPTHRNARQLHAELAQCLPEVGLYPDLSDSNCDNHDVAKSARELSLSFPSSVCCQCPFRANCEQVGYLSQLKQARRAKHVICTQERFARNPHQMVAGKQLVFIHEEAAKTFLRSDGFTLHHLGQLVDVLFAAHNQAKKLGERAEADCFHSLWKTACDAAVFVASCTKVAQIPVETINWWPHGWERSLFLKVQRYVSSNPGKTKTENIGPALRSVVDAVEGRCQLYSRPGGMADSRSHKSDVPEIVVVRKIDVPNMNGIWLEDGSASIAEIEQSVSPLSVWDMTPKGNLRRQQQVIQVPLVIHNGTRPNVVKGIVRSVLCRLPRHFKVGIISNKKHLSAITSISSEFPGQIHRVSYFRSGDDTGSNDWLDCQVLLVIGAPYVPPRAIQRELIRRGNLDAANRNGRWGDRYWIGRNVQGDEVIIRGRGYRDEDWHNAFLSVVRAKLIQAVERSRSRLPNGIPLTMVFSVEPVQAVLAEKEPWKGLPPQDAKLLGELCASAKAAGLLKWGKKKDGSDLTASIPNQSVLQKVADILSSLSGQHMLPTELPKKGIATRSLAKKLKQSERTVREGLRRLETKGIARRIGQRKGWIPAFFTHSEDATLA